MSDLAILAAADSYRLDCLSRGLSPKTLEMQRYWIGRLIEFLYARWTRRVDSLAQVTPNHMRAFFADMIQSGFAPATVAQAFGKLHAFWKWLEAEKLIELSPMDRLQAPPIPKKLVPRLNEEQIVKLWRALDTTGWPVRNRALILLMLDSGLRRGEVIGLTLADVDLKAGTLRVLKAKGGKQRVVPIGETTSRALKAWLEERGPGREGRQELFIDDEGLPLSGDAIRSMLKRLKRKLGFRKLGAHLLRHTMATRFLAHGGNLKACSQILGHARITTTADVYIDFDIEDLKAQHRAASPADHLDALAAGAPKKEEHHEQPRRIRRTEKLRRSPEALPGRKPRRAVPAHRQAR